MPQCHEDHNYRRILGVGQCSFALRLPFKLRLRSNDEIKRRAALTLAK